MNIEDKIEAAISLILRLIILFLVANGLFWPVTDWSDWLMVFNQFVLAGAISTFESL